MATLVVAESRGDPFLHVRTYVCAVVTVPDDSFMTSLLAERFHDAFLLAKGVPTVLSDRISPDCGLVMEFVGGHSRSVTCRWGM